MSGNELPLHVEREVIEHLRTCDECRERFDSFISFTYEHIEKQQTKEKERIS